MEVVNFYERLPRHLKEQMEYYNPNAPVMPSHPCRVMIAAPSGVGKTNILLNFIDKMRCFDEVYVVCPTVSQPLYQLMKIKLGDKVHLISNYDDIPSLASLEEKDKNESRDKKRNAKGKSLKRRKQRAFIFDDVVSDAGVQPLISEFFARGRPMNVSCFYLTQSYYPCPKFVRQQLTHLVLLKQSSSKDLKSVLREHSIGDDIEDVETMYKEHIAEDDTKEFPFLMIDIQAPPALRYHKNFDKIISIERKDATCQDNSDKKDKKRAREDTEEEETSMGPPLRKRPVRSLKA